jgi:hypothetical protein
MTAETVREVIADELLDPPYWMVHALPWPGGDVAEALFAVAPGSIGREALGDDAYQILAAADSFAKGRKARVILFSEVTRSLTRAGMTWAEHGVDWARGLAELEGYPGMYMAVSERAYGIVCNPEARPTQAFECDRDQVRAALTVKLSEDWTPYMRVSCWAQLPTTSRHEHQN